MNFSMGRENWIMILKSEDLPKMNKLRPRGYWSEGDNMKSKKTKIIMGLVAFVAVIAAFIVIYFNFREKPVEGTKEVVIKVVDNNKETTTYELKTDAKYLKEAMDEAEGLEYSGTEGQYGLMIDTINGIRADYTLDGAYWSFYISDEYCNYGISEQPIEDGDVFSIVYESAAE